MTTTYLLKHNPKAWTWDNLGECAALLKAGRRFVYTWSTGRSGRPTIGDRVFLIRLGVEPKGVFGSGEIITDPFRRPHWDPYRAAQGVCDYAVEIAFDTLLVPGEEPILRLDILQRPPLDAMFWTTQGTCVSIPAHLAAALEIAWAPYAGNHSHRP
jgi:5-methylcytosine-specific restriction protein A